MPARVIHNMAKIVNNRQAFTLMEILVALVIFVLLIASFVSLIVASKRYMLHSRSRISGGEIGRQFLEPLQLDVRQDQWGSNCLSAGLNCNTTAWTDPSSGIVYTPTYTFSNTNNLRKLRLDITWNEP